MGEEESITTLLCCVPHAMVGSTAAWVPTFSARGHRVVKEPHHVA